MNWFPDRGGRKSRTKRINIKVKINEKKKYKRGGKAPIAKRERRKGPDSGSSKNEEGDSTPSVCRLARLPSACCDVFLGISPPGNISPNMRVVRLTTSGRLLKSLHTRGDWSHIAAVATLAASA